MANLAPMRNAMTAEEFIATNQSRFGSAWRYELIDGAIVGHAAPTPAHAAILTNLGAILKQKLKGNAGGCRAETGSAATPEREQRNTARIPDALVRCGKLPRVTFEIVSPSELRDIRERDKKRQDVKDVEGVTEIVEVYQHTMAAHVHRRSSNGTWSFSSVSGPDDNIELESLGISIPLGELYDGITADDEE